MWKSEFVREILLRLKRKGSLLFSSVGGKRRLMLSMMSWKFVFPFSSIESSPLT